MRVSIVTEPGLGYPEGNEFYSPSEKFPEYRYDHLATRPNKVYEMVRRSLAALGLDRERFGSSAWNPLADMIPGGSSVFVLCNFVYHRRPTETVAAFHSKCTHASVLRALLDYVLLAIGPSGRVAFGNAPLQSCRWEQVLRDTGASTVLSFYRRAGQNVEARDLRLFVAERGFFGNVERTVARDGAGQAVEIDLGAESLLSELASKRGVSCHYRVSQYDPRRTESYHRGNSHRYVINRAILEADVVLSVPKLKTHDKVGITCGLKGFVGAVGHKDCLAHHRFGSPAMGGDEYPGGGGGRHMISRFHDWVYSHDHGQPFLGVLQVVDISLSRLVRRLGAIQAGGWRGNDTAWRMALDVARIVHYADASGCMHDRLQRTHLALIDGIVGGEGDGPLSPRPMDSSVLVFSDNVAAGDRAACLLMGFEPAEIPIVREGWRDGKYALVDSGGAKPAITLNGTGIPESELNAVLPRAFLSPRGWRPGVTGRPTPGKVASNG